MVDIFNEIETNGTVYIEKELFGLLDQINCSPKFLRRNNETSCDVSVFN